jgi:predicted extracellular nuclease
MNLKMRQIFTILIILGLLVPASALAAPQAYVAPAASVFINEIHYDNTGTDAGEAIEVAGPAGTDLTGWSLVLYNGANGAAYNTTPLSGTIPDQQGGYGTVAVSYPVNGIQNGSPDGVALVDASSTVLMFLSYEGSFTAVGGPANGLDSTDIGVAETGSEPTGLSLQLTGTGLTYDQFSWSGPASASFGAINTGQSFGVVANQPVSIQCPTSIDLLAQEGASIDITASDPDGVVSDVAIDSVVPSDSSFSLTNLSPAQSVGDQASATLSIAAGVPVSNYDVTVTASNTDATPQTASCTIRAYVHELLTIGAVQGAVQDSDNGLTFSSPYVGQFVYIKGVIYEKIISRTSSGAANYGFFIQNTAATADGDPNTSDGIFVYMGYYQDLIGGYVPQVGDEVIISGRISEYFNLTEMSSARLFRLERTGVDVNAEVPAFEANPPADLADANRYWERHEGMRATIPQDSLIISGRDVFASTLDAEIWAANPSSAIAQRSDPYTRRSFRDPHPLDDIPNELFDNGNGYRIVMGSLGIKASADDSAAMLNPARTFDTMAAPATGGVYFSFSKYQIQVEQPLSLTEGVDPSQNNPPQVFDRQQEYSVVTFNMENLYDFRDDPFDGCDFTGDSGCPGVYPPFDYVPASQADYETRLGQIAEQIVSGLHNPDVVLAQEIEDQDICSLNAGQLVCGTTNNADGKPDALEELATKITALGGPQYDSAYDRDGADDRGIVSAFLFRADRVQLLPADASDPVLGSNPTVDYRSAGLPFNYDVQNPKALNAVLPADVDLSTGVDGSNVFTRAPEVGHFRMWRGAIDQSVYTDLYLVDNHFSSTPNARVGQRTEQAAYNAAIVAALEAADPNARILVGGDLNVYPRPDDPFMPGDALFPSDQLAALYNQGMTNLYDSLLAEVPVAAYSYVYQGQAQTLDQIFASPTSMGEFVQMRSAHINSDFPKDYPLDGPRGTSDHDPQVARFSLSVSVERLQDLVNFYAANSSINKQSVTDLLQLHLNLAKQFRDQGQMDAYYAQVFVFSTLVESRTAQFIDATAGQALQAEAQLLLASISNP